MPADGACALHSPSTTFCPLGVKLRPSTTFCPLGVKLRVSKIFFVAGLPGSVVFLAWTQDCASDEDSVGLNTRVGRDT